MSPVIEAHLHARLPVNIVALPSGSEAQAMRALIKCSAAWPSTDWHAGDFVLGQGRCRYLLIAGHGDVAEGFWLDRYASSSTLMLRGEYRRQAMSRWICRAARSSPLPAERQRR